MSIAHLGFCEQLPILKGLIFPFRTQAGEARKHDTHNQACEVI